MSSSDSGNVYEDAEAGIRFEVPKSWKATPKEGWIEFTSDDDAMFCYVQEAEKATLQEALADVDNELEAEGVEDVKVVGEATNDTLNGMPITSLKGTGKYDGENQKWNAGVIMAKKPLVFFVIGNDAAQQKHGADFGNFMRSFQKL